MEKLVDIHQYIVYSIERILDFAFFKAIFLALFLLFEFLLGGSLAPGIIVSVILLCVFDFLTGITAAKITGEEIKSSKVVRSAFKLTVYLLLISAAHITEKAVPIVAYFSDEAIVAFLALTELISIIENVGKMGFAVPQKMLNKLTEFRDK